MEFTVSQVAEILGCDPTDIAQIGQIIPPDNPGRGKGTRSKYSFKNLVEVQIFRLLNQFGVPRKRIREYVDNLSKLKFPWLNENNVQGWAVLDDKWGWSIGATPNDAIEVITHNHPVGAAVVIDIGRIKYALYERIKELEYNVGRIE